MRILLIELRQKVDTPDTRSLIRTRRGRDYQLI